MSDRCLGLSSCTAAEQLDTLAWPAAARLPALQEEAALSRAQRTGTAAARRAAARMAEQWLELVASPEWRALTRRFPEAVARLEAVASSEGRGGAEHARANSDGASAGEL